ncbi:hypothetical protein PR048_031689 [Dryococelus australis]|uniref:Uncharacterized protein n=1 Tax=Dryococelus australis TaxID=614101 RepID=A0ABQ9GA07_9NEOP|nr:hypothetical protein PR048_031689 [Dryococelus australis]
MIGWASMWERAMCLIGYCMLRSVRPVTPFCWRAYLQFVIQVIGSPPHSSVFSGDTGATQATRIPFAEGSYVGIVPDDAACRRGFLGISRLPCPFIPALLHTNLASPPSAPYWLNCRLTLAQSSPSTVTADNQCAVDVGICIHNIVEFNPHVIELANFPGRYWNNREPLEAGRNTSNQVENENAPSLLQKPNKKVAVTRVCIGRRIFACDRKITRILQVLEVAAIDLEAGVQTTPKVVKGMDEDMLRDSINSCPTGPLLMESSCTYVGIGKFREFNDLLARLHSPVYTGDSHICSLAADPHSSHRCYVVRENPRLDTTVKWMAQKSPDLASSQFIGRVVASSAVALSPIFHIALYFINFFMGYGDTFLDSCRTLPLLLYGSTLDTSTPHRDKRFSVGPPRCSSVEKRVPTRAVQPEREWLHSSTAANGETMPTRVYTVLSTGMQRRDKREIPDQTRRPEASFDTIPKCQNPGVTPPGNERYSPRWEANSLTTVPPRLPRVSVPNGIREATTGAAVSRMCRTPSGPMAEVLSTHHTAEAPVRRGLRNLACEIFIPLLIVCCLLEKVFSYLTGPLSIRKHRHGSYVIRVQTINTCQKAVAFHRRSRGEGVFPGFYLVITGIHSPAAGRQPGPAILFSGTEGAVRHDLPFNTRCRVRQGILNTRGDSRRVLLRWRAQPLPVAHCFQLGGSEPVYTVPCAGAGSALHLYPGRQDNAAGVEGRQQQQVVAETLDEAGACSMGGGGAIPPEDSIASRLLDLVRHRRRRPSGRAGMLSSMLSPLAIVDARELRVSPPFPPFFVAPEAGARGAVGILRGTEAKNAPPRRRLRARREVAMPSTGCSRLHSYVYTRTSDVHWLLPHRVASDTSHLTLWHLLLVSLRFCYWLRVVQGVSNKLRSNSDVNFSVHVLDIYLWPYYNASRQGKQDSVRSGVAPKFSHVAIVPGQRRRPAGFLGDLPFSPPLHSGDAPYSPHSILIGYQDFDDKSHPNGSLLSACMGHTFYLCASVLSDLGHDYTHVLGRVSALEVCFAGNRPDQKLTHGFPAAVHL